jgi:hypothetical protein
MLRSHKSKLYDREEGKRKKRGRGEGEEREKRGV